MVIPDKCKVLCVGDTSCVLVYLLLSSCFDPQMKKLPLVNPAKSMIDVLIDLDNVGVVYVNVRMNTMPKMMNAVS